MSFRFQRLAIPEVILVEATALVDGRGFFLETYRRSAFAANGVDAVFVQDNYSHSTRGVLRGLHYQKRPQAQAKLVGVVRGQIFDVAVDIRKGSPTYGRWVSVLLSGDNGRWLYLPAGFAHGFCVLSSDADVVYKATAEYAPDLDRGIRWNDPALAIAWPITTPILSEKDAALPLLENADNDFLFEPTTARSDG